MEKNKKLIIAITSGISFLDIFYSLFFNIYIMQNVTSNVIHLLSYYAIALVIALLLIFPFFKILNKKSSIWIYRTSFILSFVITLLTMLVSSRFAYALILINSLRYVYNFCFYTPNEIASIHNTKSHNVNKFLAIKRICSVGVNVAFSLLISYIFEHFNVLILFAIMLVDIVGMFTLSFFISEFGITDGFRPIEFIKKAKTTNHMKSVYMTHFCKRISESGVVNTLIPIMIFLKLGSKFSLGILSSVASVLMILALTLFTKLYKHRHKALIIGDILNIICSVLLIIFVNKVVYIIYFFSNKIITILVSNAQCSTLFAGIQNDELMLYKKEHIFVYTSIGLMAELVSYIVGITLCILIPLEIAIPIIITTFMLMQFACILFIRRADHKMPYLEQSNADN